MTPVSPTACCSSPPAPAECSADPARGDRHRAVLSTVGDPVSARLWRVHGRCRCDPQLPAGDRDAVRAASPIWRRCRSHRRWCNSGARRPAWRVLGVYGMSSGGLRAGSGFTVGLLGGLIGLHWSLGLSAAALTFATGLVFLYSLVDSAPESPVPHVALNWSSSPSPPAPASRARETSSSTCAPHRCASPHDGKRKRSR